MLKETTKKVNLKEFISILKEAKDPQKIEERDLKFTFLVQPLCQEQVSVSCSHTELEQGLDSLSDEEKAVLLKFGWIVGML